MNTVTWKTSITIMDNKHVHKIESKEAVDFLKKKILFYWKEESEGKQFFPAPQPVSIERKDFEILKKEVYVVCAKLDGERFLFYSTKIPVNFFSKKSKKISINLLVNRKFEFFIIDQFFKTELDETLLDGEILDDQFVIHDSIIINGINLKKENWDIRWKTCDDFIVTNYIFNEKSTFRMCLKKFYYLNHISELFKEIKKENIKSDGIVFYPVNKPIKYKTQNDLFKWKPPGKHTIDFKIRKNGENLDLYVYNRQKDQLFASIPLSRITYPIKDNMVMEFTVKDNTFYPFKIRNDKKNSNNYYTAKKTMLNVRENITEKQLCRLLFSPFKRKSKIYN